MWIVSEDKDYYPVVKTFAKESDAIDEYNIIKKSIADEELYTSDRCVFISEVKDLAAGKDYELTDENTDEPITNILGV